MTFYQCPSCGASQGEDFNPAFFLLETQIAGIADLFDDTYQDTDCTACKARLGIQPSLVVAFTDPDILWVVFGTLVHPDQQAALLDKLATDLGLPPTAIESLYQLRLQVAARLKQRLPAVNELLARRDSDFLMEHWREYPPRYFAAIAVVMIARVPGVDLVVRPRPDGAASDIQALFEEIANLQAQAWLSLVAAWIDNADQPRTLEQDLRMYIDPGAFFPGSLEVAAAYLDRLQALPDLPGQDQYVIEAVRASLYAVDEEVNPNAGRWAAYFFALEMDLHLLDQLPSKAKSLLIAEQRARRTIPYQAAWDACLRQIQAMQEKAHGRPAGQYYQWLEEAASKAGYPDILDHILQYGHRLSSSESIPVEMLVEAAREALARVDPSDISLGLFDVEGRYLVERQRLDDLIVFTDALIESLGGDETARGRADHWLGKHLKEARAPARYLERIGAQARPWEHNLSTGVKTALWTERSNALRLLGRNQEALEITKQVHDLLVGIEDEEARFTTDLNLGILMRETGSPDQALPVLMALLGRKLSNRERRMAHESIAATCKDLGQISASIEHLQQALDLATGPEQAHAPRLRAALASFLAGTNRLDEAVRILRELKLDQDLDSVSLLGAASAWLNILFKQPEQCPDEVIDQLYDRLTTLMETAEANGDIISHLSALRIAAWITQVLEKPEAVEFWLALYGAHEHHHQPQNPQTLLILAAHAFLRQQLARARELLLKVPPALAMIYQGVQDVAQAAEGTFEIPVALDYLKQVVLFTENSGARFADVRLVSELSRDIIGRIRLGWASPGASPADALANGLGDIVLGSLRPSAGSLGLLEWIDVEDRIGAFLTIIPSDGQVASWWMESPEIDVRALSDKIRQRLKNWRPGRRGDPFDLSEWQDLELTFQKEVGKHLQPGDHLVIIEHEEYAGLPWHVAAAPFWTCSYTSSWGRLLTLHERAPAKKDGFLGLALVPRYAESEPVLLALRNSADHLRSLAERAHRPFLGVEGSVCDRKAIMDLLVQVDILKLLCHGFVDSDGEVALMVAHSGALPLANSVAAGTEAGQPHRLSWRDLQSTSKAPAMIFSSACSSGLNRLAGLGERLGFLTALAPRGAQAMVAPWWDIVAEAVLPILDATMESYISSPLSLAAALRSACQEAERSLPRWLAWALAIEGDWR